MIISRHISKVISILVSLIVLIEMVVAPVYAAKPIAIDAGAWNTLFLMDDGTVWGMGDAMSGALGSNVSINKSDPLSFYKAVPVKIEGISNVIQTATGAGFCIALRDDGTIWTWGSDSDGQLGVGGINGNYSATPIQVSGLNNIIDVEAHGFNSLVLCANGSLWIWGSNFDGQIPNYKEKVRNTPLHIQDIPKAKAIAWNLLLSDNGTVFGLTDSVKNIFGDIRLTNVKAMDTGNNHIIVLKEDGTVWTSGMNDWGQLGNGNRDTSSTPVEVKGLSGIKAIAAGGYHNVALKEDGTVWTWGLNKYGQLGIGVPENQGISQADEKLPDVFIGSAPPNQYYIDDYRSVPVQVPGLTNIRSISAGQFDTFAIADNGTIWAWGNNEYGQLGDMPENVPGHGKPSIKDHPFIVSFSPLKNDSSSEHSNNVSSTLIPSYSVTGPTIDTTTGWSFTQLLEAIVLLVIVFGATGYYFVIRKR